MLPLDAAVVRTWASLMHRRSDTLHEDAMIAAVAKPHGLTVVTRNLYGFAHFGVAVFNPYPEGSANQLLGGSFLRSVSFALPDG